MIKPNNLRRARLALDLSQREVAELIGVWTATISRYETGKMEPTWYHLAHLAEVLDESPEVLLPPPPLPPRSAFRPVIRERHHLRRASAQAVAAAGDGEWDDPDDDDD